MNDTSDEQRGSECGDSGSLERRGSRTAALLLLALLIGVLLFYRLGSRPLWDLDEGMHAATSKTMVTSGDWVVPMHNGEPFYDKPALYNWLVAISFRTLGFTEFAARLASAVLGVGCVLVTGLLGRRMFGPTVGGLAVAILVTSPEFLILSRSVVHDICLLFFFLLSLYFFRLARSSERRRGIFLACFYVACGFAVLAKGPLGIVLPGLVIGPFLLLRGELRFVRRMMPIRGALLVLLVAAPWYAAVALRDPEYGSYFLIRKNLLQFLSTDQRHVQPVYYYLPILIGGFFPWSFLLPLGVARAVRRRLRDIEEGRLFCLLWFAVIFLFFSVSRAKLSTYILPIFPAMSLLVALPIAELFRSADFKLRRAFAISLLPLGILVPAGLGFLLLSPPDSVTHDIGLAPSRIQLLAAGSGALLALALFLFVRGRYRAFFGGLVGTVAATFVALIVFVLPAVDPYRSTKGLARILDEVLPPGEEMVFFRRIRDSAMFYTGREGRVLRQPAEVARLFASPDAVFCVVERRHLDRIDVEYFVRAEEGQKLLLTNRETFPSAASPETDGPRR
jgi:4-amino-4-deoxy-L-arabinose transferase-like glycosyltransferase